MYPDQDNTQHGGGQPPAEDPDKTSVVERPNLEQLAGAMQGGGGAQPQEDDAPATEVMSGDALDGMFGGSDPATHDGTVEMQNPYSDSGNAGPPEDEFEVAATEVVSGDAVGGMFENLQNQGGASEPADSSTTVESSPPDLNSWEQESQQQPQNQQPQQRQSQQPPAQPRQQQQAPQARQQGQQQAQQQRPSTPPSQPQQPQGGASPPQTPGGGGQAQSGSPASASNQSIREFTPDESQEPAAEPPTPEAPAADQSDQADQGGPSADYDGPWKLKTNFGLTYEFPDTSGLKNWLSNREELDGYKLAGDDGDFRPLDAWPQIGGGGGGPSSSQQMASYDQGGSPSGQPSGSRSPSSPPPSMTNNTSGSGPSQSLGSNTQPPSPGSSSPDQKDSIPPGKKINPQEFRPPSQEAKWNKVLWVVFLVLALVATAIGLQTFEIYDVKGLILGESSDQQAQKTPPPSKATGEKAEKADKAESGEDEAEKEREERINKQIEQLMGDAERALENNRLQTALDKLDRAKTLDPERPKVFDLMATVYQEMGQTEDAEEAQAEAKRLREQSLSKNEKGADGAEKSEN